VRARIVAVLVTAAVAVGSFLPTSDAAAHWLTGPCALTQAPTESIQHLSAREIACAVEQFGPVPGGAKRAICIARRESGLNPTAASRPTGMYVGLYQHLAAAWPARFADWTSPAWRLPSSPFSARTNAIVTIRMVQAMGRWPAAGWPSRGCMGKPRPKPG
jgi:hypothetical protein